MAVKTIKLEIVREGADIICPDIATLGIVLGTKGVAGNLRLYDVRKKDVSYIVPVKSIRKRIEALEKRKTRIEEYLRIMRQVTS